MNPLDTAVFAETLILKHNASQHIKIYIRSKAYKSMHSAIHLKATMIHILSSINL